MKLVYPHKFNVKDHDEHKLFTIKDTDRLIVGSGTGGIYIYSDKNMPHSHTKVVYPSMDHCSWGEAFRNERNKVR